jgi:hypothetical protein
LGPAVLAAVAEPLRAAPLRAGKGTTYEGGVRVPYIFRWPGTIEPNRTEATPITSVDLYPTLLEIAGAEPPADYPLDGESYAGLLTGEKQSLERDAIYWHFPGYLGAGEGPRMWRTICCSLRLCGKAFGGPIARCPRRCARRLCACCRRKMTMKKSTLCLYRRHSRTLSTGSTRTGRIHMRRTARYTRTSAGTFRTHGNDLDFPAILLGQDKRSLDRGSIVCIQHHSTGILNEFAIPNLHRRQDIRHLLDTYAKFHSGL